MTTKSFFTFLLAKCSYFAIFGFNLYTFYNILMTVNSLYDTIRIKRYENYLSDILFFF